MVIFGIGSVPRSSAAGRASNGIPRFAGSILVALAACLAASTTANADEQKPKSNHWAFQPVKKIKPPVLHDPWIDTPIDAFVLAKLKEQRLIPSAAASKLALIRRVTFDLIGLPPTPEEVQAFLADKSDDAYERLVDKLLASPRYGERFARHWLELARYADSDGYENDSDRPFAYKYRDYVVKSFNDDKPYNVFVLEQLAGDEVGQVRAAGSEQRAAIVPSGRPGIGGERKTTTAAAIANSASPSPIEEERDKEKRTAELRVALGFCRAGPVVGNQASEKNRLDEVDDMLSTASSVFLGLTVGCARCHDHKSEPISQRDYYRLFAVFNNAAKVDGDEILSLSDPGLKIRKTFILEGGSPDAPGEEVQCGVPAVIDNGKAKFPTTAGDMSGSVGRRLTLARWIADAENPLTARVIVNRLWHWHFGRGLAATPSNLGTSGDAPTHPELIDYLAGELVREGWQLKPMHKKIVMSATYRQASAVDPQKAGRDPENKWLSRFPLRRLEAEAIRDAVLAASGKLNLTMYGPGVQPKLPASVIATGSKAMWPSVAEDGPLQWRRSVYIFTKRSLLMPLLEGFDAPNATQTCERRLTTTVATQALQLMNGEFTNEQARWMAMRVLRDASEDLPRQVERAYWLAFSRAPSDAERRTAVEFVNTRYAATLQGLLDKRANADSKTREQLRQRALADLCHVLVNANEFVYLE